jgi:hypothetical protein
LYGNDLDQKSECTNDAAKIFFNSKRGDGPKWCCQKEFLPSSKAVKDTDAAVKKILFHHLSCERTNQRLNESH